MSKWTIVSVMRKRVMERRLVAITEASATAASVNPTPSRLGSSRRLASLRAPAEARCNRSESPRSDQMRVIVWRSITLAASRGNVAGSPVWTAAQCRRTGQIVQPSDVTAARKQ